MRRCGAARRSSTGTRNCLLSESSRTRWDRLRGERDEPEVGHLWRLGRCRVTSSCRASRSSERSDCGRAYDSRAGATAQARPACRGRLSISRRRRGSTPDRRGQRRQPLVADPAHHQGQRAGHRSRPRTPTAPRPSSTSRPASQVAAEKPTISPVVAQVSPSVTARGRAPIALDQREGRDQGRARCPTPASTSRTASSRVDVDERQHHAPSRSSPPPRAAATGGRGPSAVDRPEDQPGEHAAAGVAGEQRTGQAAVRRPRRRTPPR